MPVAHGLQVFARDDLDQLPGERGAHVRIREALTRSVLSVPVGSRVVAASRRQVLLQEVSERDG